MHLVKTFSVLRQLSVHRSHINRLCPLLPFTKRASSAKSTVEEAQDKESTVAEEKKIMAGPFIKNLFVGAFDAEILEYPEYPSIDHIRELDRLTNPLEEYFLNCVDSKIIDETGEIPEDISNAIKEYNLYGLQVPKHLGGDELDDKCYTRFLESVGSDVSLSTSLTNHYRALHTLLMFGTEEQKEKLIPRMTSGELKVAVCIIEKPNILSISDLDTIALPSKTNDWTLNGKKIWVSGGDKADYFLVFAKTWKGTLNVTTNSELTLFLIDRNSPGVECSDNIDQLGTRAVGLCDVSFKNVSVPKENIVGEIGNGSNVALQCLSKGRLSSAAASVGYLKNLLNAVTIYTLETKIEGKALYFLEYYKNKLGAMATDIYALESMVYLTAGLKDTYDNPDLSLEEAVTKIYSMEKVVEIVDLCANVMGGSAYIKGSPMERAIRDARSYLLHDIVPVNVSKIHVATLGLHHAGNQIEAEIKKARNPFNFPGFAIKNFFNDRKALDYDFKVPEVLRLNLHPSLSGDADKLERCVLQMECIVKNLFRRWGIEIIDRHMDLMELTNCITSMYGMVAVLGRASRAYSIGLTNSNFDLAVANVFCGVKSVEIKESFERIYSGPMETYITPQVSIGEQVAMSRGYFFQHPLARNY